MQLKQMNTHMNPHPSSSSYNVGDVVLLKNQKQVDMWPTVEQVHPPDGTAKDTITRFMQTSFLLEYPDEPDAAPPDVGHQMRTSPPRVCCRI